MLHLYQEPLLFDIWLSVQLQRLNLSSNALVGSLPETWSNLTNVSLVILVHLLILAHAKAATMPQLRVCVKFENAGHRAQYILVILFVIIRCQCVEAL